MNKYEKAVVELLTAQLEAMRDIAAHYGKVAVAKPAPKKKAARKAAKHR